MEGCARRLVLALCCFLIFNYGASQDITDDDSGILTDSSSTTDDGTGDSESGPLQFQSYISIEKFEFGKLHQNKLDPTTVLVARQSSIATLSINTTEFEENTVVGSKEQKNIVDAVGLEARFYYVFDVAQITDKKIWIASELTYNCLRKIDTETLEVSTFSGTCDAQAAKETKIGPLSETKWSLPGLMEYIEATKKLYVSSDGGLRVIDMEESTVEVVVEALDPIYDLLVTDQNTLLMLHSSQINELDPAEPDSSSVIWNKEDVTDVAFSFVFDMAKVDDDRLLLVDDTQGIWLLNKMTGELANVCPGGSLTVSTGSDVKCYEEPAAIQHVSYIKENLFVLSYWSQTDVDSNFELGVFLGSSLPSVSESVTAETSTESVMEAGVTDNVTMSMTNTTEGEEPMVQNVTTTMNDTTSLPELMDTTTATAVNETETSPVDMMNTTMVNETTSMSEETTPMTNETTEAVEDPSLEMITMSTEGNDTTSNNTEVAGSTTEAVTTEVTTQTMEDTTDDPFTKSVEEKTPEITTPPAKPGKSDTGASRDNSASRQIGISFTCWSVFAAGLMSLL